MSKKNHSTSQNEKTWQSKAWLILFLIAFVSYANTLFHDFALDDSIVITENMYTVEGISGWKGLLSKDTFYGFFRKEGKAQLVSGGRYRPLSPMSFALEYQIFKDNPLPYHLMNIIFYGLLVVLLFRWLQAILEKKKWAFWVSFAAAFIFCVHPLHTEVVANIKGRDEIFALMFAILAAIYSLKAVKEESNGIKNMVLSSAFFFMGLMSKENAITFLAIIPAAIYFFQSKKSKHILLSITGPFCATLLFLAIRYSVIGTGISEAPLELMNNPFLKFNGSTYEYMTWGEKFPMILLALGKYLILFLFPHPLTHDYYPKMIEMVSFSDPLVIASLLAYLMLIALMIYYFKRKPIISWGILIFLASLSIVSNILFSVGTNMSERFLFMPSVGLCLLVAYLLYHVFRSNLKLFKISALLIGSILLVKTVARNNAWKDNYTLFTTDIETSSRSAKLQNAVGGVLLERVPDLKDGPEKEKLLDQAIDHLTQAKKIHPTYKSPNLLLGNALFYKSEFKEAKRYYELALKQDPDFSDAIMNLALCERELGNFDQSITLLKSLQSDLRVGNKSKIQLELSYEEAGKFNSQRGAWNEALNYFQEGLKAGGEKAKFNYFVGVTYAQMGQLNEALQYLSEALKYPSEENNRQNILRAYEQVKADLEQ